VFKMAAFCLCTSLDRSNSGTEMGECPIVLVAYMAVCECVCVWRERNIVRDYWLSIFQNIVLLSPVSRCVHPA